MENVYTIRTSGPAQSGASPASCRFKQGGRLAIESSFLEAGKWVYQPSTVVNGVVSATVTHLSRYVVLTDNMPPAGATVTYQSKTFTTVTLGLSATDMSGIDKYDIYRNGELIGAAESNSFTDTGARADNSYQYKITATDPLGNISNYSSVITVAMDPAVVITGLAPQSGMARALVTITGVNFGSARGTVKLGSTEVGPAAITLWTEDVIDFYMPDLAGTGAVRLWIATAKGQDSNEVAFNFQGEVPSLPAAFYGAIPFDGGAVAASSLVEGQSVDSVVTTEDNYYSVPARLIV